MSKWVILKKIDSMGEALQLQAFLQSKGIECDVPNMASNSMLNYFTTVRVWVREHQLEDAKKLLVHLSIAPELSEEAQEETAEEQPLRHLKPALGAALLGVLIPLLPNLYSMYLLLNHGTKSSWKAWLIWLINFLALAFYYFNFIGA